jgi:hypothetical protein
VLSNILFKNKIGLIKAYLKMENIILKLLYQIIMGFLIFLIFFIVHVIFILELSMKIIKLIIGLGIHMTLMLLGFKNKIIYLD